MVTGYQRQHRKGINYIPCEGADTQTTDQYTRLITHVANAEGIHEQFSRACEQACITGMVLLQPYLDFTEMTLLRVQLKLKVWEYNSFLIDPYFRSPDASDAQFVWCQEYISKKEAEDSIPRQNSKISLLWPERRKDMVHSISCLKTTTWHAMTSWFLAMYGISGSDKKKRLYSKSQQSVL